MTYVPVDVPAFGGLNVANDAEDSRGALDIKNLSLSDPSPSRLVTRPGYTLIGTEDLSAATGVCKADCLGATTYIVAGAAYVKAMATDGTVGGSKTNFTTGDPWTVVSFGAPITASAYAANGVAFGKVATNYATTIPTVYTKASGASSYTSGRAAPIPYTLAAQPKDNRLVAAGFGANANGPNGTATATSRVYFSQPDDGERWDETDYVDLTYGDGESIRAALDWNDYLLVFKQTKFFVFYGNSTDADGGTVFNYRTVANAFGGSSSAIYQGQVCSSPSGVYVITDTGVWKTTGGQPALVSGALAPLFNTNLYTRGYDGSGLTRIAPRSATGSGGSFWHEGCVWFSVTLTRGASTTSSGWLVFDEQSGEWAVHEFADTPRVGASSGGSVVFPSGLSTSGRKGLLSMDGTATTDNGTAISWYYVSPYSNLGSAVEKRVRQTELHGSGTCDVSWGRDLQAHGYARSVTMLNGRGLDRTAVRGESLSWKVSGSGAFRLNRVIPFVADQRASGVKT